jgi:hypothetical protein
MGRNAVSNKLVRELQPWDKGRSDRQVPEFASLLPSESLNVRLSTSVNARTLLDLESQVAETLLVSLDQFEAVLLAIVENAVVPSLLGFWASTARFERLSVLSERGS